MTFSRMSETLEKEGPGEPSQRTSSLETIRGALELSRKVQLSLKTVSQGERAATLIADRQIVATEGRPVPPDGKASERLKQALERMRDEIAVGAAEIGLDVNAPDFESQLQSKVAAGTSVVTSARVIDFSAEARDWAHHATKPTRAGDYPGELSERLLVAAEVEALRRDADLIRAHDLQLASRAAAVLSREPSAKLQELAVDLSTLRQDPGLSHRRASGSTGQAGGPDLPEDAPNREAANRAREQLAHWAGEAPATASTRTPWPTTMPVVALSRAQKAQSLALRASAESSRHAYADVADTDRALRQAVERLVTPDRDSTSQDSNEPSDGQLTQKARIEQISQEVGRSMKIAEKLDAFSDGQRKLAEETSRAGEEAAPALAERQRGLADEISKLAPVKPIPSVTMAGSSPTPSDDPDWRDHAVATLLAVQVQLAAMPHQVTDAQAAADRWRQAVERVSAARRSADAASVDHKPAALREADQAEQDSVNATHRLELASAPLTPPVAEAIGVLLEPFSPELTASRTAMANALLPAMKSFAAAIHSQDTNSAAGAGAALRQAIETCQLELARARDDIAGLDPLVAAKWFARAAVDALGRRPPDLLMAREDQGLTTTALNRAWDASIHHAAVLRLAELPAMHALFAPEPIADDGSRLVGGARVSIAGAAAVGGPAAPSITRNWRRLPPRDGDGATPHQADPAGYEAALRAYFEALGSVGGAKEK
jgi:hypothetical protein